MDDRKGKRLHRCSCPSCKSRRHPEVAEYHRSINRVMAELDERSRRLFAKSPASRVRRLIAGSVNVMHHSQVNSTAFGVLVVAES